MALTTRRSLFTASAAFAATALVGAGAAAPALAATTLSRGSRGSAVTVLQQRLNSLGYWCGNPDGSFGHLTQQAVWALQKAAGLSRDGRVGPNTRRALDKGVRPSGRTSSSDRSVVFEIDLKRQLILCYTRGRLAYILNTSTASGERYYSSGSWKTARTPKGTFRFERFISRGWRNAELGRLYRPAYFKGGYAIHGSLSIPPHPASHGCARLSTSAMDMLWAGSWFKKGYKVLVY